ncbi:MAG: winged helix-turn-helix transcriptional regulator [Nitrospira sp.]|nr:winged helix-turn-helix transcriptional regulator [Nitrospira sp.]
MIPDILTLRILDSLIDDDEAIDEIYLEANFVRSDYSLRMLRVGGFRLASVIERLAELEHDGIISSERYRGYGETHGIGGLIFRLTPKGRELWHQHFQSIDRETVYATIPDSGPG